MAVAKQLIFIQDQMLVIHNQLRKYTKYTNKINSACSYVGRGGHAVHVWKKGKGGDTGVGEVREMLEDTLYSTYKGGERYTYKEGATGEVEGLV